MEPILDDHKTENIEDFFFAKPSLATRVKSSIIDGVMIIVLMLLASKFISMFDIESSIFNAVVFAIILLYEPICTSLGQTLGQKITGLKVVRIRNYIEDNKTQNINIFSSIARYISKGMLGWISLLIIHSDRYGQALHDKVGGSVMVYA